MTHQITPVEGDLADLVNNSFKNERHSGFIKVDGYIMTESYKRLADAIENFEIRDDDIWLCGFPKTGTTWTREMVWCIANDLDFERAKVILTQRSPLFELSALVDFTLVIRNNPGYKLSKLEDDSISSVQSLPSPRIIQTHLPFDLLPRQLRTGEKNPKIIHVVRNAKDTCISYFHYCKLFHGFIGNFEEFCTLFIGDSVIYAPFFKHALGYLDKRMEKNVLLLRFEEMKKDLPSMIEKTATFLGKNLTTDQVSTLAEHLSFASMKANPAVNMEHVVARLKKLTNYKDEAEFMRSGNVEQWKTDMSPEIIERFDNWTRENFQGTSTHLNL